MPTPPTPSATILSTWKHGLPANDAALAILARGGSALDAVEAGARVVELDCPDRSVGLGGMPDRDGIVTLDASIMTDDGRCGSVAAVEGVVHPISLARRVMEDTPHCLLVGEGARQFAQFTRGVADPRVGGRQDGDDAAGVHRHRVVGQHYARRFHRHDGRRNDQQVD